MIFKQLFDKETYTFTYLLADETTREAVLIDTVDTQVDRDLDLLASLNLNLKYVVETHVHADHITGAGRLREATGALTIVPDESVSCCDRVVHDGDLISFGSYQLKALSTPGHTAHCTSYLLEQEAMVFTGDTLFIGGTGRTDFQGGSAHSLYHSIHEQLFSLPDHVTVYPGHDYHGRFQSTIGAEKHENPRLAGKSEAEFVQLMDNLELPLPKRIHEAVPANKGCGVSPTAIKVPDGMEVTVPWLEANRHLVDVIDVRGKDEFAQSHIEDADCIPLDTLRDVASKWTTRSRPMVVNCRSGRRSLVAVQILRNLGHPLCFSLKGGILDWNKAVPTLEGV